MTVVYIVLGILGVFLYFLGGVVWFFISPNEFSPLWLQILTTIFWPVILVLGIVLLVLAYIIGYILIFLYNLFKAITGR